MTGSEPGIVQPTYIAMAAAATAAGVKTRWSPPQAKRTAETTYAVGLGPAVSAPRHYVGSTLELPPHAQSVHLPPVVELSAAPAGPGGAA
jgi:hypothetical protein